MPGLTVYRSNRLEVLSVALASTLSSRPPADPHALIEVVVGNRGTERWLRHQLAQHLGVCANIDFPFPTTVLDRALATVLGPPPSDPDEPATVDPWTPEILTWAILEVLPGLLAEPGFGPVRAYLDADPSGAVSPRRHALARQLADILDRYVTFRPELACALSAAAPDDPPEALPEALHWQALLWRALDDRFGPDAPHRAARLAAAREVLHPGAHVEAAIAPIRVFGVSSLPPSYLELLSLLARVAEVDLFLLCPSDQYWANLHGRRHALGGWRRLESAEIAPRLRAEGLTGEDGSPLLASFGRVARDFQILLESQPDSYAEDRRVEAFLRPSEAPRALDRLQADILTLRAPAGALALSPDDDSVQLHVCHGPIRQVEVLRDVLLGLFDDHTHLQPRDVVVLTPDIERFAPLVSAVFSDGLPEPGAQGWGGAGGPQIPFQITDLSARRTNPVAAALLRVLEMATGRVEAPAVLDLLALEPVRDRFGVAADDLPRVATWIRESGARWGVDAAHRAANGQPEDKANTWRFGLERLLLGVTMADEGRRFQALAPVDDVEGREAALLGKAVRFIATLVTELEALRAPRALAAWIEALEGTLLRMTAVEARAAWLVRRVRSALHELRDSGARAGSALPISVEALRTELTGRFSQSAAGDHQQSGAVTFSALLPMRSIPYKVVVLLGMDDGAFPRSVPGLAFDATQLAPRVGDRNPRDEDRYLFLEALLAAREHLLVLYTGRDQRSNEVLPPAVPVSELRDVLDLTFAPGPKGEGASARLTSEHPLQPFSERNFIPPATRPARAPWSFDQRLLAGALAAREERVTPPIFDSSRAAPAPAPGTAADAARTRLDLEVLVRFLARPTRYLMRSVVKANLDARDEALEAREPISLDGLERWRLRDTALRAALAGDEVGDVLAALRGVGSLPLGYAGEAQVRDTWQLAEAVRAEATRIVGSSPPWSRPDAAVAIELAFDDLVLTGQLTEVSGPDLISLEIGKESGRRLIGPWVRLLAWRARGAPPTTSALVLFGAVVKREPKVDVRQLYPETLDAGAARELLAALVEVFRQGTRHPVPLFPEASWKFAWALRGTDIGAADFAVSDPGLARRPEVRQAANAAAAAFEGQAGFAGGKGDLDDVYVRTLYPDGFPFLATDGPEGDVARAFARLAVTVWGPLIAARRTASKILSAAARAAGMAP